MKIENYKIQHTPLAHRHSSIRIKKKKTNSVKVGFSLRCMWMYTHITYNSMIGICDVYLDIHFTFYTEWCFFPGTWT